MPGSKSFSPGENMNYPRDKGYHRDELGSRFKSQESWITLSYRVK